MSGKDKRIPPKKAYEITMQVLAEGKIPIDEVIWRTVGTIAGWNEYHAERCEKLEARANYLKQQIAVLEQKVKKARGYGFVYVLEGEGYYKIGYSKRPPQRKKEISPKMPFELNLLCAIETDDALALESELHTTFEDKHLRGEWFALTTDDLDYIRQLGNGKGAAHGTR